MSQRIPFIVGNWKCFKTIEEARLLVRQIREGFGDESEVDVVVAPPYTALAVVAGELAGSPVQMAGQNVHWEAQGAWTGEICTEQLLDVGCQYAIVGHSERRQFFCETAETVARRVQRCLESGIVPILCTGETQEDRQSGRAKDVILGDLERCVSGLTASGLSRIIIAYEPVWAIGTGLTATPEAAQEVHGWIRQWLGARDGAQLADEIRILYGGSVKADNVSDLLREKDIDGALIGGASLSAESFLSILRVAARHLAAG